MVPENVLKQNGFNNNVTSPTTVDLESHLLQNCALERFRTRRVDTKNVTAPSRVDIE